jgi:hypothetical protein
MKPLFSEIGPPKRSRIERIADVAFWVWLAYTTWELITMK